MIFRFWDTFFLKYFHFLIWQNEIYSNSKQVLNSFNLGLSSFGLSITHRLWTLGPKLQEGPAIALTSRTHYPRPWSSAEANSNRLSWMLAANLAPHLHREAKGLWKVAIIFLIDLHPQLPWVLWLTGKWISLDRSQRISFDFTASRWGNTNCALALRTSSCMFMHAGTPEHLSLFC